MAYVAIHIYRMIMRAIEEYTDPRTTNFPLVGSPFPMMFVIGTYLAFVLSIGPKWMAKRKPYDLKNIMRIYNALQVLANAYLFIIGLQNSYLRKEFSLTCQPIDFSNTEPWMIRLLHISYGYYLTKYLDLFDTVFIILRKKNNQISFLHVYHHAGMVFCVYFFMTFLAGSHSTMLGVINLFIHMVMYSYYFATSLRPIQETLWWKRHITELQLLQFSYLILHFLVSIVQKNCKHPIFISFIGLIQNMFMFALFFDFYYKAYLKKRKVIATEIVKNSTTKIELNSVNDLCNKINKKS